VATPLIERNATIPTKKSQVFSTASDMQTSVEIHVGQGERPMAADNKSLGKFILDGIPPAPRGIPQVEVTFDIDADGILKVSAADKATGRSQHITIHASSGLDKAEIERMRKEGEIHAAEDKARRESIEARNAADSAIYVAERAIKDLGDKADATAKADVESKIAALRTAVGGTDDKAIRDATSALHTAVQALGAAAYGPGQQGDAQGGAQGPGGSGPADDGVVDGEFKEA
jgi:molecular chaperone DnaK